MAEEARLEALRGAIDELAGELAPELVAKARREAMARVGPMLADAIARSLLEHAQAHLAGTRATPRAPEPTGLAHYVYGVARAGEPPVLDGLDGVAPGRPPFTMEHGDLAAITSLVPLADFGEEQLHENLNDVTWLEQTARAHETVLDAAIAATTIVPLRLCTIYRGEEQVREMLDREREALEDALRRLDGKTEWGVKLIVEPGALERVIAAGHETGAGEDLSPGAAYMRERRMAARSREESGRLSEEWAQRVHQRAASEAAEALLNPLQNPELSGHEGEMLLNGVYLVDRDQTDAFREEVAGVSEELRPLGASVELTGPWPPYNFVKSSIEAAR